VFNRDLTEIKATRNPIGIYIAEKEFETVEMEIKKDSMLYLFSDGYSDQPGSEGSKFLSKNLKKLCSEIANLPVEEQYRVFLKTHLDWRGKEEQIDDVLLLGVRI
jgi:serine phosphatase RsbU (regulator of sigma subunit)